MKPITVFDHFNQSVTLHLSSRESTLLATLSRHEISFMDCACVQKQPCHSPHRCEKALNVDVYTQIPVAEAQGNKVD